MVQEIRKKIVCIVGITLLTASSLSLLEGCVPAPTKKVKKADKKEIEKELVWPAPPEVPRIKFVKEYSKPQDVGKSKASSKKLVEALLGVTSEDSKLLSKPYGVHSDGKGRIYVADTILGKVVIFDTKKKEVTIIGGKGKGVLGKPMGVTTGNDGKIYVSDGASRRVVVYDKSGKYIKAIGGQKHLAQPVGLAVDDKRGRIYVVDSLAHKVVAFNKKGEVLFKIGKQGEPFEDPANRRDQVWNRSEKEGEFIFPTNITLDKNGRVYVMDTMNYRVQTFTPDGKFLSTFGSLGDQYGQFARPKGIAVNSVGHIYVADAAFNNIQIFNKEGSLLMSFGRTGTGKGEFWLPAGISIDSNDMVYVADSYNRRIQVFQYIKQPNSKKGGK